MSYLVLARKARPQTFEEVVGQQPVIRTLQNALRQDRVPHALIFSGVRGVGKTTLARIMAKALNCEQGPTPNPCNQCRCCQEITSGVNVDLHEIDGASNRGIQEIRELKEKIRYLPVGSRYKIIIIDEVHMLTSEAFNALLKTLEEPPDHVYFMFATTELHKVPVTILSRCQRYELKRVPHRELADHFQKLADQEGVRVEAGALDLIVRESEGSVRDGLSLLDQVFSYGGDKVSTDDVTQVLGLVDREVIRSLAASLLGGDLGESLQLLDQVYSFGMDLKRFINDLLGWFRALVVFRVSKNPQQLLDLPEDDLAALEETASQYSVTTLFGFFHLLLESLEKATFSARPRLALEMAMIRAVQIGEVVPVSDILSRLDAMLASGGTEPGESVVPERGTAHITAAKTPADIPPASAPTSKTFPAARPSVKQETAAPVQPPPLERQAPVAESLPPDSEPEVVAEATTTPSEERKKPTTAESENRAIRKSVRKHWPEFVEYVKERKPWMAHSLQQASQVTVKDGRMVIKYDDDTLCKLLKEKNNYTSLTEFALDFFQENLRITFKVPEGASCEVDAENGPSPQEERRALANDPLVMMAVEIFNGQVGDIRVGPRFRKDLNKKENSEQVATGQ